jgi:hypothetical protein
MYWATILYVPAAAAVLPYAILVRVMSRWRAAAAAVAWVAFAVVGSFVLLLLAIENANFTF